jgi:DNA helicase II / ATP-dependent DNA helicase PcrA
VGITRARKRLVLTSAARRRVFGEYQATEPSRFLDEIPGRPRRAGVLDHISPYRGTRGGWEYRANPYARPPRRGPDRAREEPTPFMYEDEDQTGGLRPGARVKHGQFGVGTVMSVEDLEDDQKLVVRFISVGQKTLRAKYAKLERA